MHIFEIIDKFFYFATYFRGFNLTNYLNIFLLLALFINTKEVHVQQYFDLALCLCIRRVETMDLI